MSWLAAVPVNQNCVRTIGAKDVARVLALADMQVAQRNLQCKEG